MHYHRSQPRFAPRRFLIAVMCFLAMDIASAAGKTNILLIMTDNQTASLLGAYGNREIATPHVDALAERGVLFERAYATTGVCSPSRAVLMTGLIPSANGVHNGLPATFETDNYSAIQEIRNLPQTLADAGWETALIGKYHLGSHEIPTLGFSHWVTFRGGHTTSFTDATIYDNGERYDVSEVDEHLTDFWTRKAEEYIDSRRSNEKPFFLWLSYNGPYILPPTVNEEPVSRFAEQYKDKALSIPQNPVHPYLRTFARAASGDEDDDDIVGGSYPWAAIDALNNRTAILNIAAETTHVDDGVGRVIAALEETGQLDDTLIIFLSDQGALYGQRGLWGNSSWALPAPAFAENMHIPLIFAHNGRIPQGRRHDAMINQFDIFPTILDYLGLQDQTIENSPGNSFSSLLKGNASNWKNEVFFEYIGTRAIQTERWKYVKRFAGGIEELYDLRADPDELENVVDNPALEGTKARLDQRLTRFFATYADPEWDVWQGGTGKARLYYRSERDQQFRDVFPDFKEPYTPVRPAFRD